MVFRILENRSLEESAYKQDQEQQFSEMPLFANWSYMIGDWTFYKFPSKKDSNRLVLSLLLRIQLVPVGVGRGIWKVVAWFLVSFLWGISWWHVCEANFGQVSFDLVVGKTEKDNWSHLNKNYFISEANTLKFIFLQFKVEKIVLLNFELIYFHRFSF